MQKNPQMISQKGAVNVGLNKKQTSFFKFLCPCLCSKSSDKQNKTKSNEIYQRQQFYEQETQKQQNLHQETQSNLPIGAQSSQFQDKKVDKASIIKLIREQDKKQEFKAVKFNIKRSNNLSGYLSQQKSTNENTCKVNSINNQQNSVRNNFHRDSACMPLKDEQKIQSTKLLGKQKDGKSKNKNKAHPILQKINNNRLNINRQQLLSIQKHLQNMENLPDYEFLSNWQENYENHYPINQLEENKIMVIGNHKGRLLTKITSAQLFPYPSAVERYKESLRNKKINKKYARQQANFNSDLDKYWDKRYFLFQRFDQGIKLDEESWYSVTPQSVADYISCKINVKQTILDAFCGAGGDSIKLSSSCKKIISNDIDNVKIKCLLNNAKIYDVSNIQVSCMDYFQLDCKVDAVYLAPPWGGPEYFKTQSFDPQDFQPKLSLIIQKAFTLSNNIFFLLPANTNIEALSSIISEKVRAKKGYIPQSCGLKLQKIYFNERLKFILGFFGNQQIQAEIKLTDELSYIYSMLKDSQSGIFKHKKLIRKIRQQHGMVNLLNYVFQCQSYICAQQIDKQQLNLPIMQQLPMIQRLEQFLVGKDILNKKSLQKIKQEQQFEYQYELKSRDQKNKRLKDKKIQKHLQKQTKQMQLYENLDRPSNQNDNSDQDHKRINRKADNFVNQYEQQCPEQEIISDISIQNIIQQTQRRKNGVLANRNELEQTVTSNFSSDNGIYQKNQPMVRDSIRTVSIISQFQEDQLNQVYERNRTNSDLSIVDSIYPIQKYDSLDFSIQQSGRYQESGKGDFNNKIMDRSQKNYIQSSIQRNPKNQAIGCNQSIRHSQPAYFSPRQNIKMKKNKIEQHWEQPIVQELNEDREKEF